MLMMDGYRTSRVKYINKGKEGIDMLMDVQALRELAGVDRVRGKREAYKKEENPSPLKGKV